MQLKCAALPRRGEPCNQSQAAKSPATTSTTTTSTVKTTTKTTTSRKTGAKSSSADTMHSTELGAARAVGRCGACGEEGLEGRLALRRHWRSCPKAGHNTSATSTKVKEVAAITVEETFVCSKCAKTFCSRDGLQLHTRQYCGRALARCLARLARGEAGVEEDSTRYVEENIEENDEENNVELEVNEGL